jgi:molecular chaperone DnaJ
VSSPQDLYIVLEIVRSASTNDIRKAFRKLARRYHPDINPGDRTAEEHFKRISEAYEVLSDPTKREFYDQHGFYTEGVLHQEESRRPFGFSFKTFDVAGSVQPGELFTHFFAQQAARRGPERGNDLECQISIGFAESISGLRTRISVQRRHACAGCNGLGRESRANACGHCGGVGQVVRLRAGLQFLAPCEQCSGTGKTVTECTDCGGEGRISRTDIMDIDIPAGVGVGSRIRYPGQGDMGRHGGPSGDLYVVTNVASHPFFTRVGDNVQCDLPITISEAALGAKIEVPTVDGPAVVRVPPGTQNGQILRIRGKGAPSLVQPGLRGDQFLAVRVVVPRVADERSKEILKEFAQLNADDPRKEAWKG